MLLVGYVDGHEAGAELARMALFDPMTVAWRTLSGVELSRYDEPRPVATDGEVLLMGVHPPDPGEVLPTSVIIDAERWRTPSSYPPANSATHGEVWTGSLLIALGQSGVAYDPTSDEWYLLPEAPLDAAFRESVPSVWAGDRVLIWSGLRGESSEPLMHGVAFVPRALTAVAADRLDTVEDPNLHSGPGAERFR
jgi:hypothetical protein